MHFSTLGLAALAAASAVTAAPLEQRQAVDSNAQLSVGEEGIFDLSTIQTYKLSYANSSAFIGMIKYEDYSEPLVLSGAPGVGSSNAGGLTFLSIHSAPTGAQYGYIMPGVTAPLNFTAPHTGGEMPNGAAATGFFFSGGGPLLWKGRNNFYACQSPDLKAINSYQVWWKGGPQLPVGVDCVGPIGIMQTDPCTRGN